MQQNNDSGDGAGAEPNSLQAQDSEMALAAQNQLDNQDGGQAAGQEGVDVGNKPVFGPSAAKILAPMMQIQLFHQIQNLSPQTDRLSKNRNITSSKACTVVTVA